MTSLHMQVKIRPAETIADYLFTRNLRNSISHLLTGYPQKISISQQMSFFLFKPKNIKLYIAQVDKKKVGYLLLRIEKNTTYITEAIQHRFRGKGIGTSMINFAKNNFNHLTADIAPSNLPSIRLHIANGFKIVSENPNLISFTYNSEE